MTGSQQTLDTVLKLSLIVVIWLVVFWFFAEIAQFLSPILVLLSLTFLMTYILLGPVNWLERLFQNILRLMGEKLHSTFYQWAEGHFARAFCIVMMYCVSVIMVVIIGFRFTPVIWNQLLDFSSHIPQYVQVSEDWLLSQKFTRPYFHQEVEKLHETQMTGFSDKQWDTIRTRNKSSALTAIEKQLIRDKIFHKNIQFNTLLEKNPGTTLNQFGRFLGTTLSGIVYSLTGLVLMFYLLLDGNRIKNYALALLPGFLRHDTGLLMESFHQVMFGFVKTQFLLGAVTGAFMVLIYSIFDVPNALLLGGFFAVAEILPVVGTWIGFTPGILVLLFMSPLKLLVVMVIVYIFQTLKDNIVAPKIMGDIMGLHPVVVILSLLICAKVAGLIGILFAIPLASMINVMIRFIQQKELDRFQR